MGSLEIYDGAVAVIATGQALESFIISWIGEVGISGVGRL